MDVAGLADSLGLDGSTTRKLLETFVTATTSDLTELRSALASENAERTAELAHHIKGAAANLELEAMRAAALSLEKTARSGTLQRPEPAVKTIADELDAVSAALGNS